MTESFDDLGLAPALGAGTEALGWDTPSGLQRDAMAVLRRGNNVVLHASAGSGAAGAYGLAVLHRLLDSETAPTDDAGSDATADTDRATGDGPRARPQPPRPGGDVRPREHHVVAGGH